MPDVDAMAAVAGVTRRTVERWRREGCPWPKHREALATWAERLATWREARDLARRNGRRNTPPAPGQKPPVDWDEQSKRALALQRMHNLAVMRGEYLPRKEVVDAWSRRVFAVRTRLLALPRVLAARCANLAPDEIEREADSAVREILAQFQADAVETPAPSQPDDQVQP